LRTQVDFYIASFLRDPRSLRVVHASPFFRNNAEMLKKWILLGKPILESAFSEIVLFFPSIPDYSRSNNIVINSTVYPNSDAAIPRVTQKEIDLDGYPRISAKHYDHGAGWITCTSVVLKRTLVNK